MAAQNSSDIKGSSMYCVMVIKGSSMLYCICLRWGAAEIGINNALNDALLEEAEASRDKWDKSGKHTWKSLEGARKELMSW